ncbi:MAG TPA: hypothetical protein VGG97_15995 [Bryobacteraceae bacterium]
MGVILLLVLGAYALPPVRFRDGHATSHSVPPPWLAGLILCALGTPWEASIWVGWGKGTLPGVPFGLVLVGGLAWAGFTFFLVRRWTASPDWGDAHRFALVFGGVLACMLAGFWVFKIGGALRIDWIGKSIMNAAALVWLLAVGRSLRKSSSTS